MKPLKLLLTTILLMMAYVANAQTIQVYKDGAVVKEYSSAEVDSVVYKPAAAQPRYYYYTGWTKPESEADLAELAKAPYGGIVDMSKTYSASNVLYDYTLPGHGIEGEKKQFFVVIPKNFRIYDADKADAMNYYISDGTIGEHNIYKTVKPFSTIDTIILF